MTVQALSAVTYHSRSRLGARLVLLDLANECSDGLNFISPDVGSVARRTNMTKTEVNAAIQELVDLGELEFEDDYDGYRIRLPGLETKG